MKPTQEVLRMWQTPRDERKSKAVCELSAKRSARYHQNQCLFLGAQPPPHSLRFIPKGFCTTISLSSAETPRVCTLQERRGPGDFVRLVCLFIKWLQRNDFYDCLGKAEHKIYPLKM